MYLSQIMYFHTTGAFSFLKPIFAIFIFIFEAYFKQINTKCWWTSTSPGQQQFELTNAQSAMQPRGSHCPLNTTQGLLRDPYRWPAGSSQATSGLLYSRGGGGQVNDIVTSYHPRSRLFLGGLHDTMSLNDLAT